MKNKLIICVQCLDFEGKTGSFLRNMDNEQVTQTYSNCGRLFDSLEYKNFKLTHDII